MIKTHFKLENMSMQLKLVIFFFLLAAILLFSVDVLFFRSTQKIIDSSKEAQLMMLSQETADKINRFLFERYGDIQVMAESPLLKNKQVDKHLKRDYIENVINAYKTYDYIFITDKKGNIEISSGNIPVDNTYLNWFDKITKGSTFISDFVYSTNDKSYKVYFAAPITDENGNLGGIVVERMNFNAITDIVGKVKQGERGYGFLLESGGETIFEQPALRMTPHAQIKPDSTGIFYSGQSKERFVSAYSPIKKYDNQTKHWYMVITEPVREAFVVTERLRSYTVAVIIIAVAISFIMAVILSRLITQPIRRLVSKTQQIVEGDISQNIQVESSDEIGSLAQSFNALLDNLNDMMQQVLAISGEAASLAEIRQYTDKFFENVPCAIITVDITGKITTFNPVACHILQQEAHTVLGRSIEEDFASCIRPIVDLMADCLHNGNIYLKHIIHLKDSGVPIVMNTSLQKDGNGKTIGAVGVFRSLEDIRQLEDSVIRANNLKSLGTLSAGMAHEIRNPLTSIKGYAQYIRSEIGDNSELAPDISIIISEVDRLNNIIDRFLTFARPKQPELELSNMNDVILGVIRLVRMESLPENIQLEPQLEDVPQIMLDKEQMGQAVLNMVLNAIQAMPGGGKLEILTHADQRFLEIGVSDTGVGIAFEDNDKIFEPFFTTKNKGTGLGLAICSRIIENHKGFIEVTSSPGVGTRFTIKLPLRQV